LVASRRVAGPFSQAAPQNAAFWGLVGTSAGRHGANALRCATTHRLRRNLTEYGKSPISRVHRRLVADLILSSRLHDRGKGRLAPSSVKNPESRGLVGLSDGFEVFDFAGLNGAGSDYPAN
jgi:hypothetical protein